MLEQFFHYDNRFWRFMGFVGDLLLLDFLMILCAVPVITAGTGLCASYYVCFRILEHKEGGTLRSFFHSFRDNLRQSICMTLMFLLFGGILWYDFRFIKLVLAEAPGPLAYLLAGLLGTVFLLYLMLFIYAFPLQARFENPIFTTCRNAVLLAVRNLPRTLGMLLVNGAIALASVFCIFYLPQAAIFPIMLALPAAVYFNAWMLRKILGLESGEGDGADLLEGQM